MAFCKSWCHVFRQLENRGGKYLFKCVRCDAEFIKDFNIDEYESELTV